MRGLDHLTSRHVDPATGATFMIDRTVVEGAVLPMFFKQRRVLYDEMKTVCHSLGAFLKKTTRNKKSRE